MGKYTIREEGANGTLKVKPKLLVRRYKRRFRRDHRLEIPMHTVLTAHHDGQVGKNVVTVRSRDAVYQWRIAGGKNPDAVVSEICQHIAT